jgi:hypothetical protein
MIEDELDTTFFKFTLRELKALARIMKYEFVSYEDEEGRAAFDKIFDIVNKHEHMARTNSQTT